MKNLLPATRADSAAVSHRMQLREGRFADAITLVEPVTICIPCTAPDVVAAQYCLAPWTCLRDRAARSVADDETLLSSFGSEIP